MRTAWTCYALKANLLQLALFARWLETPACNVGEVSDLAESVLQVTNAVLGRAPDSQQPEVLRFADYIGEFLSTGSRVVLIAHSQGNLYAQQALLYLRSGPLSARLGCVGVVGIAPPTSAGWPVGTSSLEQLMAVGTLSSDIVYRLPLPHTLDVHLRTAKTDTFDRWLLISFFAPPTSVVLDILFGINIHDIESYYGDDAGAAAIVSDIRNQVSQTERNCPPLPTISGVTPNSGPLAGGTNVTISGTNFTTVTSVTIGGVALGSQSVVSSTQITGTTPASSTTGPKDVIVTTSAGSSAPCFGCFSYVLGDSGVVLTLRAFVPAGFATAGLRAVLRSSRSSDTVLLNSSGIVSTRIATPPASDSVGILVDAASVSARVFIPSLFYERLPLPDTIRAVLVPMR